MTSPMRSLLRALSLLLLLAVAAYAQVITAPDKGDELEERAYTEAQSELTHEIRLRDLDATIDTDIYTYGCACIACHHGPLDCVANLTNTSMRDTAFL